MTRPLSKRGAIIAVVPMNLAALAMHQQVTVKGVFILTVASVGILWVLPQMSRNA